MNHTIQKRGDNGDFIVMKPETESGKAPVVPLPKLLPEYNSSKDDQAELFTLTQLRQYGRDCVDANQAKLVEFFRNEGHKLGFQGDVYGWTPEETAIEAMKYLLSISTNPVLSQLRK